MVRIDSELLISGFIYFLFLQAVCFAVSKRPVAVYEAADKDARDLRYWCFRRKGQLRNVFDKDILLLSIVCAMIWVFFIDYQTIISLFSDIIRSAYATQLIQCDFGSVPARRVATLPKILFLLFYMMPLLWGILYWFNKTKKYFKTWYVFFSVFLFIFIVFTAYFYTIF